MPSVLGLDVETHSVVDLRNRGAEAYSADPSTRCLMMAFEEPGVARQPDLWIEGQPPPERFVRHVQDGGFLTGWNVVGFDRKIYSRILVPRHGFPPVDDDQWRDSMHLAAHANMPRSLDGCASFVGIQYQVDLKDSNRIRFITDAKRNPIPATVLEVLEHPERFSPKLVEDLRWLVGRCLQDVTLEGTLLLRLPPWPDVEPWLRMPFIDRRINDRGILMDTVLMEGMARAAALEGARLNGEMDRITGGAVSTTTKIESLKTWLLSQGVDLPPRLAGKTDDAEEDADEGSDETAEDRKSPWRLRKNDMLDILARPDVPEPARLAIALRMEAAKSSVSKLRRGLAMSTPDGRLCGALRLGGAQATMRFSSDGLQIHNLPRDVFGNPDEVAEENSLDAKKDKALIRIMGEKALSIAIQAGRSGDPHLIRALYEKPRKDAQGRESIAGVLTWVSRMLRRVFTARQGYVLLNGDFAQVEARITAWLAQQMDVLHAFAEGQDLYRLDACSIYHLPPDQITKLMRQVGKVSRLALGFGGGPHALLAMAYGYGVILSADEAVEIVRAWREANAATRAYWYATDDAAAWAVQYPGREFFVPPCGLISYIVRDDCLMARLPSGRYLRYWQPRLHQEAWPDGRLKDRLSLTALTVKGKTVFRRSAYHTILVENQVQAIAADLLGVALSNMEREGFPVNLHVHDNVAAEEREDLASTRLPVFEQAMLDMPSWTYGLPMAVDADYGARFG